MGMPFASWQPLPSAGEIFDRINHDVLIGRLQKRMSDAGILRLIRAYLSSGITRDGVVVSRYQETPQGGPLSPLLANVLLDEVDKELERQSHCFVRYADDANVYVRSKKAGERVMALLRRMFKVAAKPMATLIDSGCPDSHDLNLSNRPVRTRTLLRCVGYRRCRGGKRAGRS